MSTQERIDRNRKNAQSSTGPKTAEGKAISSQNAIKNGFFAKNDVIPGEDPAAYEAHRADLYDEYAPMTPTECVLTQRIASLSWRMMRADRLQTTTINTLVAKAQTAAHQPDLPKFNIDGMIQELRMRDKDPEYELTDAAIILAGLAHYKRNPGSNDPAFDAAFNTAIATAMSDPAGTPICDAEIQLGTIIHNDFQGPRSLERLAMYEQRIQNNLFKTIRLIQQLQQTRRKADAAQEKRDWQRLRAEDQAERNRREAEYRQEIQDKCNPDPAAGPDSGTLNVLQEYELTKMKNELNPDAAGVSSSCHSRESGNPATTNNELRTNDSKMQNEPNSDLTSISDTTYNRSRYAKAKRNDPNQPQTQNPDDHPARNDNKKTKRATENPPK